MQVITTFLPSGSLGRRGKTDYRHNTLRLSFNRVDRWPQATGNPMHTAAEATVLPITEKMGYPGHEIIGLEFYEKKAQRKSPTSGLGLS